MAWQDKLIAVRDPSERRVHEVFRRLLCGSLPGSLALFFV